MCFKNKKYVAEIAAISSPQKDDSGCLQNKYSFDLLTFKIDHTLYGFNLILLCETGSYLGKLACQVILKTIFLWRSSSLDKHDLNQKYTTVKPVQTVP